MRCDTSLAHACVSFSGCTLDQMESEREDWEGGFHRGRGKGRDELGLSREVSG